MDNPHNKSFHMRLTEKEYDTLHNNARRAGLPLSTYMRFMMKAMRPKDKPQPDFWKFRNEWNAIGNNLNQLVHLAHRTGHIDTEKYEQFERDFCEAYTALVDDMIVPEKMDKTRIIQEAKAQAKLKSQQQ
jgi:hypothetical protein